MKSAKLKYYYSLLDLTYQELVDHLLKKYGPGLDDYFREKSYYRFLNGEIKGITKGKYSRTSEGLYCHHIDEAFTHNLSVKEAIEFFTYPFEHQLKERLVYCDLFEHLILHALISIDSKCQFGYNGFSYILFMAYDWFVNNFQPKPPWMQACKKRAFLSSEEAIELLTKIRELVPYAERDLAKLQLLPQEEYLHIVESRERQRELERTRRAVEIYLKEVREAKLFEEEEKRKNEIFHSKYPEFKRLGFTYNIRRAKIMSELFDLKYHAEFPTKKAFRNFKTDLRDDLLDELHSIISDSEL